MAGFDVITAGIVSAVWWRASAAVVLALGGCGHSAEPSPVDLTPSSCDGVEACKQECEQRNADACARVARLNEDPREADRYLIRACDLYDPWACWVLGEGLIEQAERGDDAAYRKARLYSSRACELGEASSCLLAARLYHAGLGGDLDLARAGELGARGIEQEEAGCEAGNHQACERLARYHRAVGQTERARDRAVRACRLGVASPPRGMSLAGPVRPSLDSRECQLAEELGATDAELRPWKTGADSSELLAIGAPPPPPPPKKKVAGEPATEIVPQATLEKQRVAGDKLVLPPDAVKTAMKRDGETRLVTTVKMCLDESGEVASLTMLKASGYPAYDAVIKKKMRGWRYRPFVVAGEATPVCTSVTFIYNQ